MDIMNNIFVYFFYALNIFVLFYALYYVFTGIFAFFKKNNIERTQPKNKFAIVIPARNEEKVIGALLDSLKSLNYPKDLYDIFVIPNNCTDKTEEICIEKEVNIIYCNNDFSSKGDVLKYAFFELVDEGYDAFCVFDADNISHKDFLLRMNDAIEAGAQVGQGFRDSKNPDDTWISSCYSLFYLIQNYFFNISRNNLNLSASINGTGFMITKKVLKEIGFNTVTMTEDIEFSAICALNEIKIRFIKEAITYDEQPLDFKSSWKQRKRWSVGTLQCLALYSHKLIKTGLKKKIPQCIDMAIFYMAPIFQIMSFLSIFLLSIYIKYSDTYIIKAMYNSQYVSIMAGYIISIFIALFVILILRKPIKRYIKGIFTLSLFMLTWIPINIICIFKKDNKWEKIEHTRNVDASSLV